MCVDKIKRLESFKKFEICQKLHLMYVLRSKVHKWAKDVYKAGASLALFFFEDSFIS